MKDKIIKEMATEIARTILSCPLNQGRNCDVCKFNDKDTISYDCQSYLVAEKLLEKYQPKIPEGAVVIPKEISSYDNIEKSVKTFSLDGENVDFTQEQIMALTQIISYKEKQENDIRKETAEKFAERLKEEMKERDYMGVKYKQGVFSDRDIDEICKEIIGDDKNDK